VLLLLFGDGLRTGHDAGDVRIFPGRERSALGLFLLALFALRFLLAAPLLA